MITRRYYWVTCRACGGKGYISYGAGSLPYSGTTGNAAETCPVCGGSKTQLITEEET